MLHLTVIKTISKVNMIHIILAILVNYRIVPKSEILSQMFPVSKLLYSGKVFIVFLNVRKERAILTLWDGLFQSRQLIYEHVQESETGLIPKVELNSKSGLSLLLS